MVGGSRPAEALRLADRLGALEVVLPEIGPLRGCRRARTTALTSGSTRCTWSRRWPTSREHPGTTCPAMSSRSGRAGARRRRRAGRPQALRLAALFHDISKPQTRGAGEGRVSFMGHDRAGADAAAAVLARWKASNALIRFCRTLVREHLALGFAIPDRPLDRRAAYRYLRATRPWPASSVVLSLADRLATRGPRSRLRHLRRHAETAGELLDLIALLEAEQRPPLLRGDEIARETGATGADISRLVGWLAEEQAAATITTREEALRGVREQVR